MPQLAGDWRGSRPSHQVVVVSLAGVVLGVCHPNQGSWSCIPAGHRVLQPGDNLCGGLRMLTIQCPSTQDALDGLGHVQPRSAEGCVKRHDPMREQPDDHRHTQMTSQVVPDQNESEWRRWRVRRMAQPSRPLGGRRQLRAARRPVREFRQDLQQLVLQPRVQDCSAPARR